MQKNFSILKWPGILLVAVLVISINCNKKFDAPPLEEISQLPVNFTIKELKALHTAKGTYQPITGDWVISGIVTANDQSGNLYQEVIIQDSTGAIPISISGNDLYTSYPVGRRLYIKLKGLILGDYGGVIEVGAGVDNSVAYQPSLIAIASPLAGLAIIKGSYNNTVTPLKVTLSQLTYSIQDPLQSRLIVIDSLQFDAADIGKTYADTTKNVSAVSFNLSNMNRDTIVLRNSSYANFAGQKIPAGNGSITAIYGIFNDTKQLAIRDTNDVKFYDARFNAFSAKYDFSSVTSSSGITDPTLPPNVSNLLFGNFIAANVSDNSSASSHLSFTNWPTGATNGSDNFTGTIDPTKYYEVTIVPATGTSLMLSNIRFDVGRTATGVRQVAVRSSIDGFAENLPASVSGTNTNLSIVPTNIIQIADNSFTAGLSGSIITLGSAFQNITSTATFRFYGFNAESAGGTFVLDNVVFNGFTK